MNIQLDRTLNNIENTLSDIAVIPVAGILTSAVKIPMGVTQFSVATACVVIFTVPATQSGNWSPVKYAWSHMKHGAGNVVAGAFEAIPLVGTGMYFMRKQGAPLPAAVSIQTNHENKFMPYTSLIQQDWVYGGKDDLSISEAEEKYISLLRAEQSGDGSMFVPHNLRFELGKQAIRNPYI